MTLKKKAKPSLGACVLAGGLASRMGENKARLRLGTRTMLGQIRNTIKDLGLPLRIMRRDLVPGCGPIGGIYTALKTSPWDAELFLACDMPFVSAALMARLLSQFRAGQRPIFAVGDEGAGFPFVLPQASLGRVEQQMRNKRFSLQALARILRARLIRLPRGQSSQLFNVNTPEDFAEARRRWKRIRPNKTGQVPAAARVRKMPQPRLVNRSLRVMLPPC